MKIPNNLLVTTTASIEGMKIKQYFKPISAHVVAGTNIFSDFIASLSDEFGGRSKTYQRQLSSLYTEAIELLKQSAYEIGANCILGLKVDIDEISGKGKQMFMITAIGTAVKIEYIEKNLEKEQNPDKLEVLSIEKIVELRKRKKLIQLANENTLELDDHTWDFIIQNKVKEVANQVIDKTKTIYINTLDRIEDKHYQNLISYFIALNEDDRTSIIYSYLMREDISSFSQFIFRLINDLMIFNPKKLEEYLKNKNVDVRTKALQIVITDKLFFTREDIQSFENLIQLINTTFPKTSKNSTMKKLLSSKEVEIWICQCEKKNDISSDYCTGCGKNQYGFTRSQISPDLAINRLRENIDLIKNNVA